MSQSVKKGKMFGITKMTLVVILKTLLIVLNNYWSPITIFQNKLQTQ